MFPYDPQLLVSPQATPASITDVIATMQSIDALAVDGDGLKWFNWLYFQVTNAVEDCINSGGFADASYLAELDVQFAQLYYDALKASLSNTPVLDCWQALFSRRGDTRLARIQCALSGINAHINHDLPIAIVNTCRIANLAPLHSTAQYTDYTHLNATLDSLIDEAKQTLNVRLLGEILPPVNILEDTIGLERERRSRSRWCKTKLRHSRFGAVPRFRFRYR